MQASTTFPPARQRRPRRLGIEAHTEFVTTLVAELQSSLTRLQAASGRLSGLRNDPGDSGDVGLADSVDLDRQASDIIRLVRLLDAIDGPGAHRRPAGLSLPSVLVEAVKDLEVPATVSGEWGDELFVADGESVRTGLELLLLALARDGQPVEIRVAGDRFVVIDGAAELTDPLTGWQLRCGRRVLEGEGCRVRLIRTTSGHCRLEIRSDDH